ncbi:hypothetical protein Q8A73_017293 [Channa argus]|nr:hypothetical protein Q8A73_017293 [Channa argus]
MGLYHIPPWPHPDNIASFRKPNRMKEHLLIHLPTLAVRGRRVPRLAVANDGPNLLSATTSILSELDESAFQRHKSVGGFLLRLAAYVKRILQYQKSKATHFPSEP